MSRIGKRPIAVPKGVKLEYRERRLQCSGPKGQVHFDVPRKIELEIQDGEIRIQADHENDSEARMLMGTANAVIRNLIEGVTGGFTRRLQLNGVGYRAAAAGSNLDLSLGFSKPVQYRLPAGVKAAVDNNTLIVLTSHDKVLLGQTAAQIRSLRPPEPFQGKGIRYEGEYVRRKAGKSGKK